MVCEVSELASVGNWAESTRPKCACFEFGTSSVCASMVSTDLPPASPAHGTALYSCCLCVARVCARGRRQLQRSRPERGEVGGELRRGNGHKEGASVTQAMGDAQRTRVRPTQPFIPSPRTSSPSPPLPLSTSVSPVWSSSLLVGRLNGPGFGGLRRGWTHVHESEGETISTTWIITKRKHMYI